MIEVNVGKKKLYIKGEENQWVVGKMVNRSIKNDDGKVVKTIEAFKAESFYSSTEGLIKTLLERKIRTSDANTLTELRMALSRAKDELSGMYDLSINGET